MSSRKGGAKPHNGSVNQSTKGKTISEVSEPAIDQVTDGVGGMSLDNAEDGWKEVLTKKNKNKAGGSAKSGLPQNPPPKAWGNPDGQKAGFRNGGSRKGQSSAWATQTDTFKGTAGRGKTTNQQPNNYNSRSAPIPPPLQRGWDNARPVSTLFTNDATRTMVNMSTPNTIEVKDTDLAFDDEENEFDDADDSDFDLMSDDYDSDQSQKSHGTRKLNKWFAPFFKNLDTLTVDQINEPTRQWHCPACQNGPGSIDWYSGLQPLITHAKTKGSTRVRRHRELAELLDEELRRRGTSAVPAGEAFGKWKGLVEEVIDKDIVWPPMVIIMNTQLEKDDNDKWLGMGSQELRDYFSSYATLKARHSYGPQGHRGISVLIFECSPIGYLEAERLSKHFEEQGTHRDAWDHRPVLFQPGGKRQLYGFMAQQGDLDFFNKHSSGSSGKSKLEYRIKSYQEMVVHPLKQMSEDNQQLLWFKNRVDKEQKHSKALAESFDIVSKKLRKTVEENRIVRQRTRLHHQQNKEEMDFQEQFFKEQIEVMHKAREAKEDDFEKIQQEEREKVKQFCINPALVEDPRGRGGEFEEFVKYQDEEMEEFVGEREKLIKLHKENLVELKRKHLSEEMELEKEFDAALNQLMDKYTPHPEAK